MAENQAQELVSVIVPCYQQGHFLAEAIESVRGQTYRNHEIIVVDDGSTDATAEVAARYSQVRYIRQANGGASSARNHGVRESSGNYLVFLDADDRLLPPALETGVGALTARPGYAMAFGSCRRIDERGNLLPTFWRRLAADDYYLVFLRRCYLYHPASVMFRRFICDEGARFNESLPTCSDYDFYLQVSRRWPVYCHNEVVSEYRQHGGQKSVNKRRVVDDQVKILNAQMPFISQNRRYRKMAQKGMRLLRHAHSHHLLTTAWKNFLSGRWLEARRNCREFLNYEPPLAAYVVSWAICRAGRHKLTGVKQRQSPV